MPDFKSIQDKWQKAWSDAGIFKVKEDKHKKKMDKKWKELEKRGLKRPKNYEENKQRLKDAHGW